MSRENIEFGEKSEKSVLPAVNEKFNCKASKIMAQYSEFDFSDDSKKIIFELKSRRCPKLRYTTTMIGYNKIEKGLEYIAAGWKVIFLFKFTDYFGYYRLDENFDDQCVRDGGMIDYMGNKKYAYISVYSLRCISSTVPLEELLKRDKKYLEKLLSTKSVQLKKDVREKIQKAIAV